LAKLVLKNGICEYCNNELSKEELTYEQCSCPDCNQNHVICVNCESA